jgi:hypothetical protein
MAVNQAQVDHIISTASADDPEVKLLKLQDEVELIKTSIKRLLIDIRERMNDMENPFNASMQGAGMDMGQQITRKARPEKEEPEPEEIPETRVEVPAAPAVQTPPPATQVQSPFPAVPSAQPMFGDDGLISALRAQLATGAGFTPAAEKEKLSEGKVRLQKVFRLFEWTTKNVRKFGHDRVDLMLESYRAMGYISDESAQLVKDITRLMPTSLGENHEIAAEEFVSELYELNHILNPADTTLDRDMIEVLMENKKGSLKAAGKRLEESPGTSEESDSDYLHSKDRV